MSEAFGSCFMKTVAISRTDESEMPHVAHAKAVLETPSRVDAEPSAQAAG
jgi:hypothetical protein